MKLTADQRKKFEDAGIPELADVLHFAKDLVVAVENAKSDDGKISLPESLMAAVALTPEIFSAISGVAKIPAEIGNTLKPEVIEIIADEIWPAVSGQPSMIRDRVNAVVGLLQNAANVYQTFTQPPKAHVVK